MALGKSPSPKLIDNYTKVDIYLWIIRKMIHVIFVGAGEKISINLQLEALKWFS